MIAWCLINYVFQIIYNRKGLFYVAVMKGFFINLSPILFNRFNHIIYRDKIDFWNRIILNNDYRGDNACTKNNQNRYHK